jgi:hypothetical protein
VADTGKIATEGFHAGAIKYIVLGGLVPTGAVLNATLVTFGFGLANAHLPVLLGFVANPSGPSPVNACIATAGFGTANTHKIPLLGFVPGTTPPTGSGFNIFGGALITGVRVRDL